MNDRDRLLTAREVADHLGVSIHSVLDWAQADRIPHFKLGRAVRFRLLEVERWLETCRRGPSPSKILDRSTP